MKNKLKLSVVIPAHNEEGCIEGTVTDLSQKLRQAEIEHEILVVNDNSSDRTEALLQEMSERIPELRYINNEPPNGFGFAVRCGLRSFSGDAVAVYMADASDRPEDLIQYFRVMESQGVDCVFGSRFMKESRVVDYPRFKLVINRLANFFIQSVFRLPYNDITNAFKLYRRHTIEGLNPLLSHHFNLTVELPLKSIIRGFSYAVVPNHWINRTTGVSKLKIKEMGSRYLFIVIYCFIEKWLSRGDYLHDKSARSSASAPGGLNLGLSFDEANKAVSSDRLSGHAESVSISEETKPKVSWRDRVHWINLAQIGLWMIVAMWILGRGPFFSYDEAFYYDQIMGIIKGDVFPAYGPFISGTDPTAFTPGAGLYLLYAPAFLFSSHPVMATYWLVMLSGIGLVALQFAFKKIKAPAALAFFSITLVTWNTWHFRLSDRLWNVNLYWFLSTCLFAMTLRVCYQREIKTWQAVVFGLLAAFGLQIHLGGALIVAVTGLMMLFYCSKSLFRHAGWVVLGGLLAYAPYFY